VINKNINSWIYSYFSLIIFGSFLLVTIDQYLEIDLGNLLSLIFSFVIMLTGLFAFLFALNTFDKFGFEKSKIISEKKLIKNYTMRLDELKLIVDLMIGIVKFD